MTVEFYFLVVAFKKKGNADPAIADVWESAKTWTLENHDSDFYSRCGIFGSK